MTRTPGPHADGPRLALPIDPYLDAIATTVADARRLVLSAAPGSGKTTRVAPALLAAGRLTPDAPRILLLQPRRVAARVAAARIAAESPKGWRLGREVGYHVRFEKRSGRDTVIEVITEGLLTRRLLSDPYLEGVGAVILDEFHERSLHTDMALALVREIADTVREDLRIVVMSATLDAAPVAKYLGDCPVMTIPGVTYDVAVTYEESRVVADPLIPRVVRAVIEEFEAESFGDLLVFLPGVGEITRCLHQLRDWADRSGADVTPLHGRLSLEAQDLAVRPAAAGRRKVVLATNVAETSLTIPGITVVIDAGLAREAGVDATRGLDRLVLKRISQASADQRAGRAGRTGPGRCRRLWTLAQHRGLPAFDTPEIARVDLTSTVLSVHAFGHADVNSFGWFEPPPAPRIAAAELLLERLGAWSPSARRITPLGERMLAVPAHPRIARLLLAAADAGLPEFGATLAAVIAEDDCVTSAGLQRLQRHTDPMMSDLSLRCQWLDESQRRRFSETHDIPIDTHAAKSVARVREEFLRIARHIAVTDPVRIHESYDGYDVNDFYEHDQPLRWVLAAFPDRLARRRGPRDATAVMVGGFGVRLESSSLVRDAELFLALDPREDAPRAGYPKEARVRLAVGMNEGWLEADLPEFVEKTVEVRFDPTTEKVVGVRITRFLDLVLRSEPHVAVSAPDAARVLVTELAPRVREWVHEHEHARQFLARWSWLHHQSPQTALPPPDDETLRKLLPDLCAGKRSMAELRTAPLTSFLQNLLTYSQLKTLNAEAPERLELPNGRMTTLEYPDDPSRPVILAARVQDLLGWTATPRLAGGRCPVLLHVLAPNRRPVQITSDLHGFWTSTYFQVRKDLRGRYPKQAWPEKPLEAQPVVIPSRSHTKNPPDPASPSGSPSPPAKTNPTPKKR